MNQHTRPQEVWKTQTYLGGLIDGEGTFYIYPYHVRGLWYPYTGFDLTLKSESRWNEIAVYWQKIYGGYLGEVHMRRRLFRRWRIFKVDELLKFTDDILPHLHIKKKDAERLRLFLVRYMPYKDKGKLTKEEAIELIEELTI